ncbi:hypothetical protein [Roseivirga seohaensis]|uniref:hypothetical protein n=1 Tax=Roseivirga seohaensis TaxID=1914963 RepID=UPI003BADA8A2
MNNKMRLKRRVFELFEDSWDNESVAKATGVDESQVELWWDEYNIQKGLEGLSDDPEQAAELLEAIQEFNQLKREELDLYEQERETTVLKEKRSKVILFKKLFAFIKNHSQGFKWNYSEVLLFVKKLKTLQEQTEAVCEYDETQFEMLFIWNRIVGLIDHLEQLILDKEESDTIKFNFDENDILYLDEALEIVDFDEEIEVESEEEQQLNGILEEEFTPIKY